QKIKVKPNRIPPGERAPASGRNVWVICVGLIVLTFAVFGQTAGFGFVNFDDDTNILENPLVSRGLSLAGFREAFAHGSLANWDPLTVLSHQLDCQLFGLWAGGHHLTN